jgi:DNA processing protein
VRRPYFVARNRLIAAFSDSLVVVEAGTRSGTRSTVDFTLDLGRDLYCVPGPVDCPHSTGTLQWIRDGATMVRHAADLLQDMNLLTLDEPPARVLGLGESPESTATIARRLGLSLGEAAVALVRAQAAGEVRRLPGDRWTIASGLPLP